MSQLEKTVTALDAAREFVRRGWCVVPIPLGSKAPVEKRWQEMRLTEGELPSYFNETSNIGILLGAPSGGLIDVDIDSAEAVALADSFLPTTLCVHGRPSKPNSHRWYTVPSGVEYLKLSDPLLAKSDPGGSTIIELRQDRHQTVVPPSIHPSGEPYVWQSNGDAVQTNGEQLASAVFRLAAAALLTRYWPAVGRRHDAALALAGMLLRAGWSQDDVMNFVGTVARAAGDEEYSARIGDVISTAGRLTSGLPATGKTALDQILGAHVVQQVCEWLKITQRIEVTTPRPWPDPVPVAHELPAVEKFSLEFLPSSFRPYVEDTTHRMQVPADFAGAAAIVALAGCVNRRAIIRPKAMDDSWSVIPNLWGAIVAPPGFMKSPVLNAVTRPLSKIEARWRETFNREVDQHERNREEEELKIQAWREQSKQSYKKGETAKVRPEEVAQVPKERRLLLTDTTYEKLHEILRENPAGVFVVRDELTGWLSSLDREGREGERGFYLQAWNGDGPFTVDRIGRGSIHVPAACVSLFGNIQPARLRSYLSEVDSGGPNDDGLFQRLQVTVWPDTLPAWKNVDRKPNFFAVEMMEKVFEACASRSPDNPVQMRFDPEAQQLFDQWRDELELKVRSGRGLSPSLIGHFAKYRSLMPTVAGLFELADIVGTSGVASQTVQINVGHAAQAAALCEYLASHAHRVYSCITSPEFRSARELARHIQERDLADIFTARDIYSNGWSSLTTPQDAKRALCVLEELAWVRRAESTPSPAGGRPSEPWLTNPKVVRHEK